MKTKAVWMIKLALAAALFFPLAYGTGVCLLLLSYYPFAQVLTLAAALGIYAAAAVVIYRFGYNASPANASAEGAQENRQGKGSAILFFTLLIAVIALILAKGTIAVGLTRMNAKRAYKNADEIICYQNDRNTSLDMLSTPLSKNSVLIDYDRMRASFIYRIDYDQMKQVSLAKINDTDIPDPVQFRYALSDRGRELTVYGSDKVTSGVSVEMADGSLWYSKIDNGIGFDKNAYSEIGQAAESADELKEYSAGKPKTINGYSPVIKTDTVGIDYDGMKVCLIYFSEGVARSSIIPLDSENAAPEGTVTAEIPFSKGTLYAYAVNADTSWESSRCDGLAFVDENGTWWYSPEGAWGYYGLANGRYGKH